MATKKRPTPRTKPKPKTKPKARPKSKPKALAQTPSGYVPAPVVEPQERSRGVWILLIAVLLGGLFIWKASKKAPAPQPMPPAISGQPEGRTAAPADAAAAAKPVPQPKATRRADAGAPADVDGASLTFDRTQGSLALRCWRPEGGAASLEVFGSRNLRVRTLTSESGPAGWKVLQWDGKDDKGAKVPAGLYFLRFSTDGAQQVRDVWVKG